MAVGLSSGARAIAIVGLGKIARDQHLPRIAESSDFRLAAIASRNATLDGAPGYRTIDELLSAERDVEAVALCAPPQARFAQAKAALEAGRHVLLEKPPGATLSEVATLADIAERRGATLFASWHSRYAAGVATARRWLASRRVKRVVITWREDVRHWHPGQEWIWAAGGFGVFDPGVNALSIMTEILPAPAHVTSAELDFPSNRQAPIAARLRMLGADDAEIEADFDFLQTGPQTWRIEIETENGRLRLEDGGARLFIDEVETPDAAAPATEYAGLYADFARLIAEGRSDVDVSPLRHCADAFLLGERRIVDAFDY